MFLLLKPTPEKVREFLEAQVNAPLSYSSPGMTRGDAPSGFTTDHNRIRLGEGPATFDRATKAVRAWKMFSLPWLQVWPANPPIEVGTIVAVQMSHLGFWSLNPSRIVYTLEEQNPQKRFGFAYGTLKAHAERGEERFIVEMDASGAVWYDLLAFSRPSFAARAAYPVTRALQKRFAKGSLLSMARSAGSES